MQKSISASASSAGALFSNSAFRIPPYQRDYAWSTDEIGDFWSDLSSSLKDDSYFIGLIILTEGDDVQEVIDGQQRLLSIALLASILAANAIEEGRSALASRLQADFLRFVDYSTDEEKSRITLADAEENKVLQAALNLGFDPVSRPCLDVFGGNGRIAENYKFLSARVKEDLGEDAFKRLGTWAQFLREKLYFTVFTHPDPAAAYRVFEVINTRGKGLTTADLLKNYVLSKCPEEERDLKYFQWQGLSKSFSSASSGSFVQYIRHAATARSGHIPAKELYDFLAGRLPSRPAPGVPALMQMLEEDLPLYLQMIDPTATGPASKIELSVYEALVQLGVIAVRPLLLSLHAIEADDAAFQFVLRFVVLRTVVGNLGTGNVERRIGDAAKKIRDGGQWKDATIALKDLVPTSDEFKDKLCKRPLGKHVLGFLRRSILQETMTPSLNGHLQFLVPAYAIEWPNFTEEALAFWSRTLGNTFISVGNKRPFGVDSWRDVKEQVIRDGVAYERTDALLRIDEWTPRALEEEASELAERAIDVWYG